jgi:hypothetical protein
MMRIHSVFFGFTVGISMFMLGCVPIPVSPLSAPEVPDRRNFKSELMIYGPGKATVIVTRDKRSFATACSLGIWVDAIDVANIKDGERIEMYLTPGPHIIRVGIPSGRFIMCTKAISDKASRFEAVLDSIVVLRISEFGETGKFIAIECSISTKSSRADNPTDIDFTRCPTK